VNARSPVLEQTPLHYVAEQGHVAVAELLLAKGAAVNAKSGMRQTPLDVALKNGKTELAELLRRHGGRKASAWDFLLRWFR
jgi:ankyrin repeat protein